MWQWENSKTYDGENYTTFSGQGNFSCNHFGNCFNLGNSTGYLRYKAENVNVDKGTFMTWWKPNTNLNSSEYDYNYLFIWQNDSSRTHSFRLYTNGGIYADRNVNGTLLGLYSDDLDWTANDWRHIAFTWNNETGKWCVYFDGILNDCNWNQYVGNNDSAQENDGLIELFLSWSPAHGSFDDTAFYNEVWTEEAIYSYVRANRTLNNDETFLYHHNFSNGDRLIFSYRPCDNTSFCGEWLNSSPVIVQKRKANISVNFSTTIDTINFRYGGETSSRYVNITYYNYTIKNAIKDLNLDHHHIRTEWDEWGATGLGKIQTPLRDNGTYDYEGLLMAINNSLYAGVDTLFVHLSCTPSNLTTNFSHNCRDDIPPDDYEAWGDYAYNVTKYLCEYYGNRTCEKWYWVIGNEPTEIAWTTNDTFIKTYENATVKMKRYNPNLKVGADFAGLVSQEEQDNATRFLRNITYIDFFDFHNYMDNYLYFHMDYSQQYNRPVNEDGIDQIWIEYMDETFYNLSNDRINLILSNRPGIEIFSSEMNVHSQLTANGSDSTKTSPRIFTQIQAMFFADSLYWMLKTNLSGAGWYTIEGSFTKPQDWDSPFHILFINATTHEITKHPLFNMYRHWVTYNINGSSTVQSSSTDNLVEILPVINPNGRKIITVINKRDGVLNTVNITLNENSGNIWKLNNSGLITKDLMAYNDDTNFNVSLDTYEVGFYGLKAIYRLLEGNYTKIYDESGNLLDEDANISIYVTSNSTNTIKHIASNISSTINLTIAFNVSNCNIDSINYTSNTSSYTKTYNSSEWGCTNNQVTLNVTGIEPATESNEIAITYTVTPPTETPTSTTTGGSGGGGCSQKLEITVLPEINITQGKTKPIDITVKNTGNCILYNINVSFETLVDWISDSKIISSLYRNTSQPVKLNLIPPKSTFGNYTITLKADSTVIHKIQKLTIWIQKPKLTTAEITREEIGNLTKTKMNTTGSTIPNETIQQLSQYQQEKTSIKEKGWLYYVIALIALLTVILIWREKKISRKKA